MSKFIRDFIKKDMASFKSVEEAVSFIFQWVNRWTEALQEMHKTEKENSVKEGCVGNKVVRLLCDKLEIYGIKISHDELSSNARAEIDRDWPRIKKETAEILEAREKSIEDLMNRTKENNSDNPNV